MSEEQIPVDGTITNSEDDYDPQKMLQKQVSFKVESLMQLVRWS